jgi:hypothetical protein
MIISAPSVETIQVKTKNGTITLGSRVKIDDFTLAGPGEYEVAGIEAIGIGRLYTFDVEEMCLAYLDKINGPLTNEEQDAVTNVDILFVPVGGGDVLDGKGALQVITQVDPRIVIPTYYDDIESFSKEEGVTLESIDSLKIARTNVPETERKVIVLPWKSSKK